MTDLAPVRILETDLTDLAARSGAIAVCVTPDGKLDQGARKINALTKKAVATAAESEAFEKAKAGEVLTLSFPVGLAAEAVLIVKLGRRPSVEDARKAARPLPKRGARKTCWCWAVRPRGWPIWPLAVRCAVMRSQRIKPVIRTRPVRLM